MNRSWTIKEEKLLISHYTKLGIKLCALKLGKTENSIRTKASKLGLKRSTTSKRLTDNEYVEKLKNSEYINIDPYVKSDVKIRHKHLICGFIWEISPNNLTKTYCPRCSKKPYSKLAIKWLNSISSNIIHAENGGEQNIAGYKVDGYDPITNTVYEFHGDVFHGNLDRFDPQDRPHPYNDLTAEELWEHTYQKMLELSKVAKVVYIWELDYLRGEPANEF